MGQQKERDECKLRKALVSPETFSALALEQQTHMRVRLSDEKKSENSKNSIKYIEW
jgi:hypothetical protein